MKRLVVITLTALALTSLPSALHAQDTAAGAKSRMAARLGTINAVKISQAVGENNQGYLAILKAGDLTADEKAAIQQENSDRKMVYEYIAGKTRSTPELVGQRRAKMIADQSAAGVKVQDTAGNWQTK